MKNHSFLLFLFFVLFLCYYSKAQDYDNELWSGAEADFDIGKRFSIEPGIELRLNNNIGGFKNLLLYTGVKYKISDFFRTSLYYRLKQKSDTYQNEIYASFYVKYKIKPLNLTYRIKYHKEMPIDDDQEDYLRNKIKISYNLSKTVDPYIHSELYYRFNWDKGDRFIKYRLCLGVEIKIKKNQELTFFYMYQKDINIKKPDVSSILGLFYSFNFDLF